MTTKPASFVEQGYGHIEALRGSPHLKKHPSLPQRQHLKHLQAAAAHLRRRVMARVSTLAMPRTFSFFRYSSSVMVLR